jgi:hypothetical protein
MATDPDPLLRRLGEELARAGVAAPTGGGGPVTAGEVADLPPAVQRYLAFMEVVGRPRVRSFRARFQGRFRLRPKLGWMPAEAWQYNAADPITRVFLMRLRFARVVPMIGADTYVDGHGRMLGKLFGRVTVADGSGEEFDLGELTTYLNDAILLAPSMLLGPATTWIGVDDHTFDVRLTDASRTVSARVHLDERGAPRDFSTTDRFADLPTGLVRAEWRTPISTWTTTIDGRPLPGPMAAVWHLPDGELPYVEGRIDPASLQIDVAPPG